MDILDLMIEEASPDPRGYPVRGRTETYEWRRPPPGCTAPEVTHAHDWSVFQREQKDLATTRVAIVKFGDGVLPPEAIAGETDIVFLGYLWKPDRAASLVETNPNAYKMALIGTAP